MQNDLNIDINDDYFADCDTENDAFETDVTRISKDARALEIYQSLQPESGVVVVKPPRTPDLPDSVLLYEKAEEFARKIDLSPGVFNYGYVSGEFIFGDLLEAMLVEHNLHTARLLIATLSMSYENVDSLVNLMEGGFVDKLDIVFSDYQFSHERGGVVKYMYEELSKYDFQLTVARHHCKLACFTTDDGRNIGIRGSANLRSASCVEQVFVNESATLNAVDEAVLGDLISRFATLNRDNKRALFNPKVPSRQKLWKYIQESIQNLIN